MSGHFDTLTESNNSIVKLNKRGEIQNEQHYPNASNEIQS